MSPRKKEQNEQMRAEALEKITSAADYRSRMDTETPRPRLIQAFFWLKISRGWQTLPDAV